jgi:hypothetical protein
MEGQIPARITLKIVEAGQQGSHFTGLERAETTEKQCMA